MIQLLEDLSPDDALSVSEQAIRIMRRTAHLPGDSREEYARELARVLRERDPQLALDVVAEVERREGAPLREMSAEKIDWWVGELAGRAFRRVVDSRPSNPRRGRELLRQLRAAYPL